MEKTISLGFTGEYQDPVSANYPLGHGYRWLLRELRRFNKPDSLSPFGVGGINPYAYCKGDPINHTDPSGHVGGVELLEDLKNSLQNEKSPEKISRTHSLSSLTEDQPIGVHRANSAPPNLQGKDRETSPPPKAKKPRLDSAHDKPSTSTPLQLSPTLRKKLDALPNLWETEANQDIMSIAKRLDVVKNEWISINSTQPSFDNLGETERVLFKKIYQEYYDIGEAFNVWSDKNIERIKQLQKLPSAIEGKDNTKYGLIHTYESLADRMDTMDQEIQPAYESFSRKLV
jgi:RHS repeat-associated protein